MLFRQIMLIKIKREICLEQFPNFPLREFDKKKDEEIFSYSSIIRSNWFELTFKTKSQLPKLLSEEITKLIRELGFDSLIFLGDNNCSWIRKSALQRNDYPPLKKALQYFLDNKIGVRFKGGIEVKEAQLPEFIKHFFYLTSSNAALPYFHFMDKGQNLIGYVHYDGEVQFSCLSKSFDKKFSKAILTTKLQQNARK
jgi:hypothetical protein